MQTRGRQLDRATASALRRTHQPRRATMPRSYTCAAPAEDLFSFSCPPVLGPAATFSCHGSRCANTRRPPVRGRRLLPLPVTPEGSEADSRVTAVSHPVCWRRPRPGVAGPKRCFCGLFTRRVTPPSIWPARVASGSFFPSTTSLHSLSFTTTPLAQAHNTHAVPGHCGLAKPLSALRYPSFTHNFKVSAHRRQLGSV